MSISKLDAVPPELHGVLSPGEVKDVLNSLYNLPLQVAELGKDLDNIEKQINTIQQDTNIAKKNLDIAEATCIAFPEEDLKNEAQRKAYITRKTQIEQKLIVDLQNKKLLMETTKMDINREYERLQQQFSAAKYRADLMARLLEYYGL